jgi:hypothetical protein
MDRRQEKPDISMDRFCDCDSIWDLLSAYADRQATPDESALVERHIAHCEECERALRFMQQAARLLAGTPDIAPPPSLRQAILGATVYRPTWAQRFGSALAALMPPSRVRALGAAGAVVAIFLVLLVWPREPSPPPYAAMPPARPDRIALRAGMSVPAPPPGRVKPESGSRNNPGSLTYRPAPKRWAVARTPFSRPGISPPPSLRAVSLERTAPRRSHPSPRSDRTAGPGVKPEMVSPPVEAPATPEKTPDVSPAPDRTEVARTTPAGPMEKPSASAGVSAAPKPDHITLVAALPTNSVASTLAGLRNDLRNASRINPALFTPGDRHEVTVDVFRTRF